jgi:hypothetical protein
MKKLEITRGKVRLYFDPETAFIRMDSGGGGYSLELTPEDMLALSMALWRAAKPLPRS